jgi:hypothetical protein
VFTDEYRSNVWNQLRQQDGRVLSRFLTTEIVTAACQRAGRSLGRGSLHALNLVWLGLTAAWNSSLDFASVLTLVAQLLADCQVVLPPPAAPKRCRSKGRRGAPSPHDPRGSTLDTVSEEAFTKARRRLPTSFWVALVVLLSERCLQDHRQAACWHGLRLLAMDGTCIALPAWQRLRDFFGAAGRGKGRKKTQARLVMLQCPLTRLPLAYALAALSDGETTLALQLLEHVRANDLLLLDRGFFSYGLLARVHQQGAFFAIRLKKGVSLRRLRSLGPKDQLVRWQPKKVRQQGEEALPPSLDLRLVRYQIPGFRASALLTNQTDPQRISRADWVRFVADCEAGQALQPGLYHRRWEIETTFRELKVTQGLEGSLRSRSPEGIAFEVGSHVVLYLIARWLLIEAAEQAGVDPLRLSFVHALREWERLRVVLLLAEPDRAAELVAALLSRIASHRVPNRPGRHYPRPNDTKPKNRGHGQTQKPAKLKNAQRKRNKG